MIQLAQDLFLLGLDGILKDNGRKRSQFSLFSFHDDVQTTKLRGLSIMLR